MGVVGLPSQVIWKVLKAIRTYTSLIGTKASQRASKKFSTRSKDTKAFLPSKMLWHAVAAKNLQMLKGDCNGHRPNEIICLARQLKKA